MNRIYQGRVTDVEIHVPADKKNPWQPFDPIEAKAKWQAALWQHHELFQEAVNYYVVCLLALVSDTESDLWKLRQQMIDPQSDLYVWTAFSRRGARRKGLRDSVAKYLTPGNLESSFEDCANAVLDGCDLGSANNTERAKQVLDLALKELLNECNGDGAIQQKGRGMLPAFCDPNYGGVFPRSQSVLTKAAGKEELPKLLHSPETHRNLRELSAKLDFAFFANANEGAEPLRDALAKAKLEEALAFVAHRNPGVAAKSDEFRAKIQNLPASISFPAYRGGSINKDALKLRFFAYLLFVHVEQSDLTFAALRDAFPPPKSFKTKSDSDPQTRANDPFFRFGDDPIKLARGVHGYVFRAFTSLPIWNPSNTAVPQWKEFDIAAFKEALKALDQVKDRGEERAKERQWKQSRIDYERRKVEKWTPPPESEEVRPPILEGDPRIARLEKLLDSDLADEYEMAEGQSVAYGLHPRTIRGFRELRREWLKIMPAGEGFSLAKQEKLIAKLREYQKENPNIVGSVRLFEALLEKPNWLIWQETDEPTIKSWRDAANLDEDENFAADPLQALTDERELKRAIERLRQPVRFTPADAEYSRRQFYFSDVSDLSAKGRFRHNQPTVAVEVARERDGVIRREWMRLHFGAPRLLRDHLSVEAGGESESRWQQPIMEALGLESALAKNGKPVEFADAAAVALMPNVTASGDKHFLLNFPVTLEPEPIIERIGKKALWEGQFGGGRGEHLWLHWPGTWPAKARGKPWWENKDLEEFTVLSVDLGQRDAGAFAIIKITSGPQPKPVSRFLGHAGDRDWWATLVEMGMLRLAGEDAKVLRDGQWQEEFYGERGRSTDPAEWTEARNVCEKLGLIPDEMLGTDLAWHSFPELNDRLLLALRRAQTRLARLQSWSSVAKDEKRRARVKEQILGLETDELGLKAYADKENWPVISSTVITELERFRGVIARELERIANRILPLRGRRWKWTKRQDDSGCHVLRQTLPDTDTRQKKLQGQRGLSMERLEQLEELRRRCQSLNRALRQTPGETPKLGRTTAGVELPDPCPELLEKMDKIREQRVNQTAHLILAQTLGVRLRGPQKDAGQRERHDIHGEYESCRPPVDFVVLEDLGRYLASQGRARSENTRLMKWCHRQILGKLKQLATEVYGIPVLETAASYSSRFCSRSSIAGFRAVELTDEARKDFRWRKHLDRLQAADQEGKRLDADARTESEHVKRLIEWLERINDGRRVEGKPPRTLLAPVAGGPIFVPMRGVVMQADMNAAINLGLRAIASPYNHMIHVRLRSERHGEGFRVRVDNAREKVRWQSGGPVIQFARANDCKSLLAEAHPNFFADIGNVAQFDRAEATGMPVPLASGRGLWGTINRRAWSRASQLNNDRLEKWGFGRPLPEKDDARCESE